MAKSVTISLSDEAYNAIRAASDAIHQTPEQVIVAAIAERFAPTVEAPAPSVENFLRRLRARGLLAESGPSAVMPDLPPRGTTARAQLEAEIEEALSDALDQSGQTVLDLIERR